MIYLKNVNKYYGKTKVLDNISFEINNKDIFGIVGHSGAGKSTLLRCLNGLEEFDDGEINILGKNLKDLSSKNIRILRKDVSMVFQYFNLMERSNVFENIAFPLKIWGYDKTFINNRVLELLEIIELKDKINEYPKNLSGGQKQRIGIARALALNPKILLCDEATSALDPKTTKSILELLLKINYDMGITIVMVTHQMEVVKSICNRMLLLDKGKVQTIGNTDKLFLESPNSIKLLLGEEETLPLSGINIKLFFSDENSEKSIITQMSRTLNIDISIVWGKLEKFRSNVLGSLVINIDENDMENVMKFLNKNNIHCEVL